MIFIFPGFIVYYNDDYDDYNDSDAVPVPRWQLMPVHILFTVLCFGAMMDVSIPAPQVTAGCSPVLVWPNAWNEGSRRLA